MGSLRDLTTAHRDAVASGEATIASVADSLGLARQSVWRGFKRRKWATTATLPPELPPISAPPPLAPLLPVPSPPIACVIDESQVAAVAPAVLANSLVLLLARTERLLSDPERLGPSALRQCAATLDTTLAIMERLGLRQAGDEQNSVLLIEAMTEAEVEQIRATQEVEYSSAFPDHAPNDDADGLDDAPDSPTVGRGGAASAISAPTTISCTGPSRRHLARPPWRRNRLSSKRPTSTASRRACVRRPAPAARGF